MLLLKLGEGWSAINHGQQARELKNAMKGEVLQVVMKHRQVES